MPLIFLMGFPLVLIGGAVLDVLRKERQKRLKEMERKALKELRKLEREMKGK